MSKDFETISGDDLYEALGDARYDAVAKEAGFDGDNPPPPDQEWVVQTDSAGNIIAVVAPASHE